MTHKYEIIEEISKQTEGHFINKKEVGCLSKHEVSAKDGKYLWIVNHDNPDYVHVQFSPKVCFKIFYLKKDNRVTGFEIIKTLNNAHNPKIEKITFSNFSMMHLKKFLELITSIDLESIKEQRINIENQVPLDDDAKNKLLALLQKNEGVDMLQSILDSNAVTSQDIVNLGFRKAQLQIFENLLTSPDYWKTYAKQEEISQTQEEKVFQYFLRKNPWIFGFGLDYRYLSIIQSEANVRGADISGKGTEKLDELLGTEDFTVLVELKKPTTSLFEKNDNRAGSWKLSSGLFEAVSQILEYKASHIVEFKNSDKLYAQDGSPILQDAIDPKCILLIGHSTQFCGDNKEMHIKKRTFELFRRDSRNIEIITYDELYKRAKFIVENRENKK